MYVFVVSVILYMLLTNELYCSDYNSQFQFKSYEITWILKMCFKKESPNLISSLPQVFYPLLLYSERFPFSV